MKKIIAFNGSPRKSGNTSILLEHFFNGVKNNSNLVEEFNAQEINLNYCRGCLRCNLLGRCSITGDEWEVISKKILDSDIIVFASPVYFHHVTAPLKKILDRFRSFVHVQISETGLIHTPREKWNKDFVLLLCMGSSNISDAKPIIELFDFITSILGPGNKLHAITATRLAVVKQVLKTEEQLKDLYPKLNLPINLAEEDYKKNQKILIDCYQLGYSLTK